MGSTETFIQMLESATLEPARCCSACQITEQGFLARDEMATGICRSGWSLSSCFGRPSSRTSEAARDPNAACNRGQGMLLQIVSLLILSQVALRTGDFELCNRPSNPLSTTSTLCGTIHGPAECAKRLNPATEPSGLVSGRREACWCGTLSAYKA